MSYTPTQAVPTGGQALDEPLYGAGFGQAVARFWKKYATFSGRASRAEFWWWVLASVIVSLVITAIGIAAAGGDLSSTNPPVIYSVLSGVWGLAVLIPSLALNARRLHDTDRSGWWQLLHLIPLVGAIILLVWFVSQPNPAGIRFDRAGH